MKKILLSILLFVLCASSFAQQLKIINTNTFGTTDYTNSQMTVYGNASDVDIVAYLYVINTSSQTMTLACRRTETDVLSSTFNATCWSICPADVEAGTEPVQVINLSGTTLTETVVVGDTVKTFSGHYKPKNIDGCSLMKYEWFEESNPSVTLGFVDVKFVHSSSQCSVGLNEVESTLEMSLFPNPSNDVTTLEFNKSVSDFNIELTDLLGKVHLMENMNSNMSHKINTSNLKNGIYFVSIKQGNELVKSSKLVVRH